MRMYCRSLLMAAVKRRKQMAKGTGKNGNQIAEEHVQTLIAVLDSYRDKALPRYGSEVNQSKLAKECGFDRAIFRTNPRCAELLEIADHADRQRFMTQLQQAEFRREERAKTDQDRADLEAMNLRLLAENAALRQEIERFRRLERLMADTGRLPS